MVMTSTSMFCFSSKCQTPWWFHANLYWWKSILITSFDQVCHLNVSINYIIYVQWIAEHSWSGGWFLENSEFWLKTWVIVILWTVLMYIDFLCSIYLLLISSLNNLASPVTWLLKQKRRTNLDSIVFLIQKDNFMFSWEFYILFSKMYQSLDHHLK